MTQTERVTAGGLQVAKTLYDFVNTEVLPVIGKDSAEEQEKFWDGFGKIVEEYTPRNRELLNTRDSCRRRWMPGTPTTRVHRTRRSTPRS